MKERVFMAKKQITIDAPKHPVIRYRFIDERTVQLDLRGIFSPHSPFQGRLNPTKGQKRRFVSPEHLQSMVNEYFESCNGPLLDRYGNLVYDKDGHLVKTQVEPWTMSGLALYLNVSTNTLKQYKLSRIDSLLDEMKVDTDDYMTFSDVVLRAKQKIEGYAEKRLYDRDGQQGARFVLDNCFGWLGHKEQAEIDNLIQESILKAKEFELKKDLLDAGDEDSNLTINIIRGRKDADD